MNATTALIGIGVARTVKPTVLFFILDLISAHENLRDMMPLNRPVFALNETMKSMQQLKHDLQVHCIYVSRRLGLIIRVPVGLIAGLITRSRCFSFGFRHRRIAFGESQILDARREQCILVVGSLALSQNNFYFLHGDHQLRVQSGTLE